jgi:hypothetical protein
MYDAERDQQYNSATFNFGNTYLLTYGVGQSMHHQSLPVRLEGRTGCAPGSDQFDDRPGRVQNCRVTGLRLGLGQEQENKDITRYAKEILCLNSA